MLLWQRTVKTANLQGHIRDALELVVRQFLARDAQCDKARIRLSFEHNEDSAFLLCHIFRHILRGQSGGVFKTWTRTQDRLTTEDVGSTTM